MLAAQPGLGTPRVRPVRVLQRAAQRLRGGMNVWHHAFVQNPRNPSEPDCDVCGVMEDFHERGPDVIRPADTWEPAILFDPPPAQRHSPTSVEAAKLTNAQGGRRAVLDALASAAFMGTDCAMTDEEIAEVSGLSPNTERPRRVSLVQAGLVEALDHKGTTASGRRATRWILTSDGKRAL